MTFMSTGSILKHYESFWVLVSFHLPTSTSGVTSVLTSGRSSNFLSSRSDMDGHQGFSKYVQIKSRTKKARHHIKAFRYLSSMLQVHLFFVSSYACFLCINSLQLKHVLNSYIYYVSCKQTKTTTFVFFAKTHSTVSGLFPIGNPK